MVKPIVNLECLNVIDAFYPYIIEMIFSFQFLQNHRFLGDIKWRCIIWLDSRIASLASWLIKPKMAIYCSNFGSRKYMTIFYG